MIDGLEARFVWNDLCEAWDVEINFICETGTVKKEERDEMIQAPEVLFTNEDLKIRARNIKVEEFTMMQVRQQVVDFVVNNKQGVLVVEVPTGGGKTYGLPWIIQQDVIPVLPDTRVMMLEVLRTVTEEVRKNLRGDVLDEPVGMKLGRDENQNYRGERFAIGTTGSSFAVVREGQWSMIILDEFDLDQNGDVAIMHNQLYHMLKRAQAQDERLIVMLPSATPDIINARKFYHEFTFEVLTVDDRIYDPQILEVDLGSAGAMSFKDIVDQYALVLAQFCGDGYEGHQIPVGKNVLCTVPSPVYFEELEEKILRILDETAPVEVVKVWSRSTPADKHKLFTGGTRGVTTIFIATDLIRRGGTPEIFAAFPSGWQVRDYCDSITGIEGTREERASQADYRQDEGRCSRKEQGLVIRSLDAKRPVVGMTFLERKPLETFLLNLIHHEDIRMFKWWGDVTQEKIDGAVAELKRFGAVETHEDGRTILTSLGRAMRGLPGSLRMRSMVFAADRAGILPQFLIIAAGMSAQGGLFANAKGREEIAMVQALLRCKMSDYLSMLRVWGAVSEGIAPWLDGVLQDADRAIEEKKRAARQWCGQESRCIRQKQGLNRRERHELLAELEDDLAEDITLIELSRKAKHEDAVVSLVKDVSGRIAFDRGLYKRGIESFVQSVLRAAAFLNGRRYRVNGSPERTIVLEPLELLKMGPWIRDIEEKSGSEIHKVVLGGNLDFLFQNVPHREEMGYYYQRVEDTTRENFPIFPGSATFTTKRKYLVAMPVDHKGSKYLENVIMISPEELAAWLPEVAPQLVKVEAGLDPRYDAEKDCVVSKGKTVFRNNVLWEGIQETPDHPEAARVFAGWLAGQIG